MGKRTVRRDPVAHGFLGHVYEVADMLPDALHHYTRALQEDPQSDQAQEGFAKVQAQFKKK